MRFAHGKWNFEYGRWRVIRFVGYVKGSTDKIYLCRCQCGTEREVRESYLAYGGSRSCGCVSVEKTIERSTTHGLSQSKTYKTWKGMIARCHIESATGYQNYGGRGIKVCDRWRGTNGFNNFLADMGEKPEGLTIERNDVNGNYEPENCRWATWSEQQKNKRVKV